MLSPTANLLLKLLFAIALGGLIGLEREFGKEVKKQILPMGVRTAILISVLGFIFAYMGNLLETYWFIAIGAVAILIVGTVSYYTRYKQYHFIGATTYVSMLIVYFLGVLVALDELLIAVVIAILSAAFLTYRREMHDAIKKITEIELESSLKFAIIAFVILPLLPNETIDPWGVFNPFDFWVIVIVISLVYFLMYIFLKLLRKRGILLSSLVGGLINSEATTLSLLHKWEKNKKIQQIVPGGVILTSTGMVVSQIAMVLIAYQSLEILKYIIAPIILTAIAAAVIVHLTDREIKGEIKLGSPFALWPVIKFAAIYSVVMILMTVLKDYSNYNFLIAAVGSLVSVSGVVVGIASLASVGQLALPEASIIIGFAMFMGILNKLIWGRTKNDKLTKAIYYQTMLLAGACATGVVIQYFLNTFL